VPNAFRSVWVLQNPDPATDTEREIAIAASGDVRPAYISFQTDQYYTRLQVSADGAATMKSVHGVTVTQKALRSDRDYRGANRSDTDLKVVYGVFRRSPASASL